MYAPDQAWKPIKEIRGIYHPRVLLITPLSTLLLAKQRGECGVGERGEWSNQKNLRLNTPRIYLRDFQAQSGVTRACDRFT